jgi:hypothetical protein
MCELLAFALLLLPVPSQVESKPPTPFYDWGACPFEGCTYRRWQAVKAVTVWTGRNHRRVAFTVKSGEWVRGLTGVVITTRPGISKVLVKMTLGDRPAVSVSPGDLLYTLHDLGEGFDFFWFQGKTYSDQISGEPDPDPPPPDLQIQIISRPQYVWWAKIRNLRGRVGWTDQTELFTNMDQFAGNENRNWPLGILFRFGLKNLTADERGTTQIRHDSTKKQLHLSFGHEIGI